MKSEIGFANWVLSNKLWGKTLIDGKLRSQHWWRQRLEFLINQPEDIIPQENIWDSQPIDYPIPFEVEYGCPELNYVDLLLAWKRLPKTGA